MLWIVTVPVIVALGVGSGCLSGAGNRNPWFSRLAKPRFMPPGWAFSVIWTTLYVLMGLSLAEVLAVGPSPLRNAGLVLFAIQLVLNLAWAPVFFGARRIGAGLAMVVALDLLVAAIILLFARIGAVAAAAMLLPYLLWLGAATMLNLAILRLNR